MKEFRVKVTEKHSDYVWIKAENEEEAIREAVIQSCCEYECLYDCQVVAEEDIDFRG